MKTIKSFFITICLSLTIFTGFVDAWSRPLILNQLNPSFPNPSSNWIWTGNRPQPDKYSLAKFLNKEKKLFSIAGEKNLSLTQINDVMKSFDRRIEIAEKISDATLLSFECDKTKAAKFLDIAKKVWMFYSLKDPASWKRAKDLVPILQNLQNVIFTHSVGIMSFDSSRDEQLITVDTAKQINLNYWEQGLSLECQETRDHHLDQKYGKAFSGFSEIYLLVNKKLLISNSENLTLPFELIDNDKNYNQISRYSYEIWNFLKGKEIKYSRAAYPEKLGKTGKRLLDEQKGLQLIENSINAIDSEITKVKGKYIPPGKPT